MEIIRTHSLKILYTALLLVVILITGCAGIEPYEARDHREKGPEQGLISGSEGEFVIYRKADEPGTGSEAGNGSDETADDLIQ